MKRINYNAIQCKLCGESIESKYVHDFRMCKCGSVGLDGGHQYLERKGKEENYIDLSITYEAMTYRELLEDLLQLTPEQLNTDVTIWDENKQEMFLPSLMFVDSDSNPNKEIVDVLDNGTPYLEIK